MADAVGLHRRRYGGLDSMSWFSGRRRQRPGSIYASFPKDRRPGRLTWQALLLAPKCAFSGGYEDIASKGIGHDGRESNTSEVVS